MADSKKKPTADIINPGLGDIEKVRDILFGKYVNSFEQRFAELESRLEADIDQLKNRLTEKVADIDEMINQSIGKLDEQIISERKNRDTQLNSLQDMLTSAETKLQHAINEMEDHASQEFIGLKGLIKDNENEVKSQVESVQKELVEKVDNSSQELSADKVDRNSLALLLDEVALKLRGNVD